MITDRYQMLQLAKRRIGRWFQHASVRCIQQYEQFSLSDVLFNEGGDEWLHLSVQQEQQL